MAEPRKRAAGSFRQVFNLKEPLARSRTWVMIYSLINSVNSYLTAGVFYSGFLASVGMNASQVGIVAAIPFLANLFSIFSAGLLGRFRRRRGVLVAFRAGFHTLNILAVTLLPYIIKDGTGRTVAFCAAVFAAGVLNALSLPGITEIHISVVPDRIRSDYFAYVQTINATVAGIIIIIVAFIQDSLAAANPQVFTWIRIFAYVLAMLDVIFMALPPEPEYRRTEKQNAADVFRLPFRCKPFIWTLFFMFLWNMTQMFAVANIIDNYFTVDSGVPYIFICAINASYSLFLLFLQKPWKRMIARTSWAWTFAVAAILHAPTTLLYAFTNSGNFWGIMLAVRLTQHVIGVGLNVTFANLAFVNMPVENRTSYMSFYFIAANLSSFLGMGLGTLWISAVGGNYFTLFGVNITGPQQLLLIQSFLQLVVPLSMMLSMKRLNIAGGPAERPGGPAEGSDGDPAEIPDGSSAGNSAAPSPES